MLTPEQMEQLKSEYDKACEVINAQGEIFFASPKNFELVRAFLLAQNLQPAQWGQMVFSEAILELRRQGVLEKRATKTREELAKELEAKDRSAGRQRKPDEDHIYSTKNIASGLQSLHKRLKNLLVSPDIEYEYSQGMINHARTKRGK